MRLSAIGDVIHALPVLHTLRTLRPEAHIAWATHRLAAGILEDHPELDDLILLPRRMKDARDFGGWRTLLRRLRNQPWDVAIDMQGLAKSGMVNWLSGARLRVGLGGAASREGNGLFMHRQINQTGRQQSVIELNRSLLTAVGLDPTQVEPRALLPDRAPDREFIANWARSLGLENEEFVVVDPFAGWVTKTWPQAHWGETLRKLQHKDGRRALVFFGPKERLEAEELAAVWRRQYGVDCVLAPPTTLGQATALLRMHGGLFLGGDTGPGHLAAALGVPTVLVFGPSCNLRQAPTFAGARARTLQDRTHPCTDTFRRTCPLHTQPDHCMGRTRPEHMLAAIEDVLRGTAA